MKSYRDYLNDFVDFKNFGSVIDDVILALDGVRKGKIDADKLKKGVGMCETILKGCNEYRKGSPSLENWDAYRKFMVLENSVSGSLYGFGVYLLLEKVKSLKGSLECILKNPSAADKKNIRALQGYLTEMGVPFYRVANSSFARAMS